MRILSKIELVAPIFCISIWVVLLVLFLYSFPLECIIKIIVTAICIIAYVWLTAYVTQYVMKKINERRNNIIIKMNENDEKDK